jgi:hypothetical protein
VRYEHPDLRSVCGGEWFMFEDTTRIAIFCKFEIGSRKQTLVGAVTWVPNSADRVLVGYFPHLRTEAEITWTERAKLKRQH